MFYVGKGKGRRVKHGHERNPKFMEIYNNNNCNYMFLGENLPEDEAFKKEKYYINFYKEKGEAIANTTDGGPSDGNVMTNWSDERKQEFINKMTKINKERCTTPEFKENARKNMINRYKNPDERKAQSIKAHNYWDKPENKKKHSELIKRKLKENPESIQRRNEKHYKPCILELNKSKIEFKSRKELEKYLKEKLNITIARDKITNLLKNKISYTTDKSKHKHLIGMMMYYKDVETSQ